MVAHPSSETVIQNTKPSFQTTFELTVHNYFMTTHRKNRVLFFRWKKKNSSEDHATCKENTTSSDNNIFRGVRSFTIRSLPTMTAGSKSENCSIAYVRLHVLTISVQRPREDHYSMSVLRRFWGGIGNQFQFFLHREFIGKISKIIL